MTKPLPRKGKRRTTIDVKTPRSGRATLDVFRLLAEDVGARGPEGWFEIPWRGGLNAMALVADLAERTGSRLASPTTPLVVFNSLAITDAHGDAYWCCEELRDEVSRTDLPSEVQTLCTMRLRMLQLLVSNSHGGGHGYNTVLLHGWHKLDLSPVRDVEGLVAHHRAVDALGSVDNISPRRAAAFAEAWRAGLYRAAYALARPA